MIRGKKLWFRPLTEEDLDLLGLWDEDPEVTRFTGRRFFHISPADWFRRLQANPDKLGLAIETPEHGLIGDITLECISLQDEKLVAEMRICIGRKEAWSRGNGTEAVRLLSEYAFREVGMSSIFMRVEVGHWRAIRCYQKCGFVPEGIIKSSGGRQGRSLALMVLRRYNMPHTDGNSTAMMGEEYPASASAYARKEAHRLKGFPAGQVGEGRSRSLQRGSFGFPGFGPHCTGAAPRYPTSAGRRRWLL